MEELAGFPCPGLGESAQAPAAPHQQPCISVSFRSISVQGNWLTVDGNVLSFSLVRAGLGWAKSDVMRVGPRP